MARVSFIKDDGTEIIIRNHLENEYNFVYNVFFRDYFFATKLWCEEDVAIRLEERGYKVTDESIAAVLGNCKLKALGDCTDEDWYIIDDAIHDAWIAGDLELNLIQVKHPDGFYTYVPASHNE